MSILFPVECVQKLKMFWYLLSVVVFLFVLICMELWVRHEQFEKIPGPPGIFFVENAFNFIMDPVKLFYHLRMLANKHKELFKVRIGPKKFIAIHNPEDVETIISGTKYNSKGFLYGFIEAWLDGGLLLSDGQKWSHRRKILTPAFHFNILRHFNEVIEENCWQLVKKLEVELDKPKTDISSYITDFALHSICETAMGTKLDEESSGFGRRYKEAIHKLGRYVVYRAQRVWMYSNIIYPLTILGRKQKKILQLLSSFRDNVINKRRETSIIRDLNDNEDDGALTGKKRLAMLDLLLQLEKEGKIDAKGIGEEVDTFMFEGHDTTASALQMIFMLIANNQDVQDKIVKECQEVFGLTNRSATLSDLAKLKYLDCCIKEGLRLYPPVAFMSRTIGKPLKLKEHEVPAGTDCTILIYDLQRRSDQFSEPLEFRPERFLSEKPTWHPYSYIPFSAGPRNCIGQRFAMMEMKLVISAVLRNYKLLPVTRPKEVVFVMDFILRPTKSIFVKIEKREIVENNSDCSHIEC